MTAIGSPGCTVPANTSRLIVGGTIAELGIGTIGIASAIDTGNFGFEDTGHLSNRCHTERGALSDFVHFHG